VLSRLWSYWGTKRIWKTNKEAKLDGKDVGCLRIDREQVRPVFLTKDFGGLRKEIGLIRIQRTLGSACRYENCRLRSFSLKGNDVSSRGCQPTEQGASPDNPGRVECVRDVQLNPFQGSA
jgi:hypothetical protein